MGSLSIWHWVIVALIVLVLFGKGRISEMMGDLGKGIKSFKKGMVDEETNPTASPRSIDQQFVQPVGQPVGQPAGQPAAQPTSDPAPR